MIDRKTWQKVKQLEPEMLDFAGLMTEKVDPALRNFIMRQGLAFLGAIGSSEPQSRLITGESASRWQLPLLVTIVDDNASVLDLGCGSGDLLTQLVTEKHIRPQGIDNDPASVIQCIERGVPVFQMDLDRGLDGFPDQSFDYVILEETLQRLRNPAQALAEMQRVGKKGVVSFPNFGYWRVRLDLAVTGRMPTTEWLPHRWHDTPNIHLFSILDFISYAESAKINILETHILSEGEVRPFKTGDNLYAEEALCLFEGLRK